MWLARPGTISGWSLYETPYQQLMVCDGEKIWFYDPDLSQVTVRPAAAALAGRLRNCSRSRSTLSDAFVLEDGA